MTLGTNISVVDDGHISETDCVTLILQVVSSVQSGDNFTGFEGPNQLALPVSKTLIAHIYLCKNHQYWARHFYIFCRTIELKPLYLFPHCTILIMRIPHYHNVHTSRLIILLLTTHCPMIIIKGNDLSDWVTKIANLSSIRYTVLTYYEKRVYLEYN